MQTIQAPFTPEQVQALAWFQRGSVMAPYQCHERAMLNDAEIHGAKGRLLTATAAGLSCSACGYVQASVPSAVLAFAVDRMGREPAVRVAGKKRGKR